jgi:hypothetical protein
MTHVVDGLKEIETFLWYDVVERAIVIPVVTFGSMKEIGDGALD